jgi:hypothetical protein
MAMERAVLAGRCFWGMQDMFRRREASYRRGSATPAATTQIRPMATILAMPRRSRSSQVVSYRSIL